MNTEPKPTGKDRERRIADRLAYLTEGGAGLTRRANMARAIGSKYQDEYDLAARDYVAREKAAQGPAKA